MDFAWLHMTEPFSEDELRAMEEVPPDHDDVEAAISQFEACAMEIILQPWKETITE